MDKRSYKKATSKKTASRTPFLWGVGTLGNIGGNYISFHDYMRKNNTDELRDDWKKVGGDMCKAMAELRK